MIVRISKGVITIKIMRSKRFEFVLKQGTCPLVSIQNVYEKVLMRKSSYPRPSARVTAFFLLNYYSHFATCSLVPKVIGFLIAKPDNVPIGHMAHQVLALYL